MEVFMKGVSFNLLKKQKTDEAYCNSRSGHGRHYDG